MDSKGWQHFFIAKKKSKQNYQVTYVQASSVQSQTFHKPDPGVLHILLC